MTLRDALDIIYCIDSMMLQNDGMLWNYAKEQDQGFEREL